MLKEGPFISYTVDYGTTLGNLLYILCIVLLYWVISPIILVFATGFFFSNYLSYKYQFVFATGKYLYSKCKSIVYVHFFCTF